MVVPEPLRWLLTLALAGGTLFHLGRALRPGTVSHEHRVAESLHAVMGVAMVAMLWPFGRVVPASAWLVVFAGSTGWFAAQASRAGRRWVVPVYFASAAAAMVWMCVALPGMEAGGGAGMSMGAGSGMSMGAGSGMGMGAAMDAGAGVGHGPNVWAAAAVGGYLVVAGLGWLVSGLRLGGLRAEPVGGPERGAWHWPALCHGVMGVSMGLTMLAMV